MRAKATAVRVDGGNPPAPANAPRIAADVEDYLATIDLIASRLSRHNLGVLLNIFCTKHLPVFAYRRLGEHFERAFTSEALVDPEIDLADDFVEEVRGRLQQHTGLSLRDEYHLLFVRFHERLPRVWKMVSRIPVLGWKMELATRFGYFARAQSRIAAHLLGILAGVPQRRAAFARGQSLPVHLTNGIPPLPDLDGLWF